MKSEDEERRLALEWHERRAATRKAKSSPTRRGFGQTLIEEALPYQLVAKTLLEFGENELRCSIAMHLDTEATEDGSARS